MPFDSKINVEGRIDRAVHEQKVLRLGIVLGIICVPRLDVSAVARRNPEQSQCPQGMCTGASPSQIHNLPSSLEFAKVVAYARNHWSTSRCHRYRHCPLLSTAAGESDPLGWLQSMNFQKLAAVLDAPWSVAVSDLIYPETTGTRPEHFEQSMKFSAGILRLAAQDPEVHKLMTEVQQLLKPPSIFNDPDLRQRVAQWMA
jgi:hypothetical protein